MKNERGNGVLISAIVMVLIGVVGLQVSHMGNESQVVGVSDVKNEAAKALAMGGIEGAFLDLEKGQNPNKSYSIGNIGSNSVVITADPEAGTITSKGMIENGSFDSQKTFTINAKFSADDVVLNVEHASYKNNLLQGLYFEKTGSRINIIDKIKISWNESYCARLVTCPNPTAEDPHVDSPGNGCWGAPPDWTPYEDPNNHNKVLLCSTTPGNSGAQHTISVSKSAVETHYCHHDDTLGACNGIPPEPEPIFVTCEEENLTEVLDYTLNDFCSQTSAGKHVEKIVLNSVTVFNEGSVPAPQTVQASSGDLIDIVNVTMTTAGNYSINSIRFDENIADGTWFTVEAYFLDGSKDRKTFKVRTYNMDTTALANQQNDVSHGSDYSTVDAQGNKTGEVSISANGNYVFTAKVLGSQMTCGQNGPAANVTARIRINNTFENAFGSPTVAAGEVFTRDNLVVQNDYAIEATARMPSCNNYARTVMSTDTTLVKFLINGDSPPSTLNGFGGQQPVSDILSPYISNNLISLPKNQVIALFELGNDPGSVNSDFQDLVLMITITKQ